MPAQAEMTRTEAARIAIVMKGYPRLSETFIAQEILALEARDLSFEIWSLRHPTDAHVHPMHARIRATAKYLPEYLYREPLRVLRGFAFALRQDGLRRLLGAFVADLRRDPTPNRLRRLGQACVMARELPAAIEHVHVHYLHTPASVVRYAAMLRGFSWSFSAHAKDIWTTPEWEKREKLADSQWGVTCTRQGHAHLTKLAPEGERVGLLYHGLDLKGFPAPPARPARNGANAADPVRIVSVGRAVAKKGYDDLLTALAALPGDLNWQFVHIGGGELLDRLKQQTRQDGIAGRVTFMGARPQPDVIAMLREADLFVLPAKRAKSGDQDGLPNVILEAASQELAVLATSFAAIPEFIGDGREGVLVPPGDWIALANAINLMARDPARRAALGRAARQRLVGEFGSEAGIEALERRLRAALARQPQLAAWPRDTVPEAVAP
jgi:glycosyltransferase involved in cell wall biosynthesis